VPLARSQRLRGASSPAIRQQDSTAKFFLGYSHSRNQSPRLRQDSHLGGRNFGLPESHFSVYDAPLILAHDDDEFWISSAELAVCFLNNTELLPLLSQVMAVYDFDNSTAFVEELAHVFSLYAKKLRDLTINSTEDTICQFMLADRGSVCAHTASLLVAFIVSPSYRNCWRTVDLANICQQVDYLAMQSPFARGINDGGVRTLLRPSISKFLYSNWAFIG
jgi:hypothetical protein